MRGDAGQGEGEFFLCPPVHAEVFVFGMLGVLIYSHGSSLQHKHVVNPWEDPLTKAVQLQLDD